MSAETVVDLLSRLGLPAVLVGLLVYAILKPEKAEKVAGWFWGGLSKVWKSVDSNAVKYQVAGTINGAIKAHSRDWPADLVEGDIRINWADGVDTEARLDRGEVVVFMQRADHKDANVANALLAYLPRAVAPRARRYVHKDTMRAADLTLAKGLLADIEGHDALQALFSAHVDPAVAQSEVLRNRLEHMDDVDVHGWLTRILLVELKRLADKVYPGGVTPAILHEAEHFVDWLHKLAIREHGSAAERLLFEGRYLRVAIVFVAQRQRLEMHGTDPYRKTAKRYLYQGNVDAVYLLARDDNNHAVESIAQALESDGRVEDVELLRFKLRSDFEARHHLRRKSGVIARVTRRHAPRTDGEAPLDAMLGDNQEGEERYVLPGYEPRDTSTPGGGVNGSTSR